MICAECGDVFESPYVVQKFCTSRCQQRTAGRLQTKRRKENPAAYRRNKGNIRAQQAARHARVKAFLREYLLEHPCVDCGESDPVVLEFDHVRGDKSFAISSAASKSEGTLITEIAKCEVRCATCHRRKTYREKDYLRRYKPLAASAPVVVAGQTAMEKPPPDEITLSREFFRELGRRRWRGKSEEEKSAHGKMMARAREKKEAAAPEAEAPELCVHCRHGKHPGYCVARCVVCNPKIQWQQAAK